MTLHFIGLGLYDEKDISVKGLEIIKSAHKIYLEHYTAVLSCSVKRLETFYDQDIEIAERDFVEKGPDQMLSEAKDHDVAFLVVGDPMAATTHLDLMLRAKKMGVKVHYVPNASIMNAIGVVGLELYKYGKTTSVVFPEPGWKVDTPYDVLKQNSQQGLHTLCLLDIKISEPSKEDLRYGDSSSPQESRFMTVSQAIKALMEIESRRQENFFTDETLCVGCARIGGSDMVVRAGKAKELLDIDFGAPLHSLIVPGNLHFIEEEALELWKG